MAVTLNSAFLCGNLAKDPELKEKNGKSYARLVVVTDDYAGKDSSGKAEYKPSYWDVIALNKTAEFVAKNYKKGDRVTVQGSMKLDVKKDGDKKWEITGFKIFADFVAGPNKPANGNGSGKTAEAPAQTAQDDDIPF